MEQEIIKKLVELDGKINSIYISVEKTRKYFLWTMIITVAVVVLPVIGLMFILPSFMNTYVSSLSGLGL